MNLIQTDIKETIKNESTRNKLLIVDDDEPLLNRLRLSFERKNLEVYSATSINQARHVALQSIPDFAVLDLRLSDGNSLILVEYLHDINPNMRIIILTGYGNIANAISAVKAGAIDYLPKPADAESIFNSLNNMPENKSLPPPPEAPMSADRVRWEHIQRVYEQCNNNTSETARRLRMHRRTLQRVLRKYAPKE